MKKYTITLNGKNGSADKTITCEADSLIMALRFAHDMTNSAYYTIGIVKTEEEIAAEKRARDAFLMAAFA